MSSFPLSSKYQVLEKLENNGKFLEFTQLEGLNKTLYSVFIYDHYPGNNPYFKTIPEHPRRILKDSGILYDFGKAYGIFKKWKEGF